MVESISFSAARQYELARKVVDQSGLQATGKTQPNPVAEGISDFAEVFQQVETTTTALARGEGEAQAVVEAIATAELALETAVTIRNRVVEAYQELLRLPI